MDDLTLDQLKVALGDLREFMYDLEKVQHKDDEVVTLIGQAAELHKALQRKIEKK